MLKTGFRNAFPLTLRILKQAKLPLLALFVIGTTLTIPLEDGIRHLLPTQETERYTLIIMGGLWDLIEGVILFLLLSKAVVEVERLKTPEFERQPFKDPYLGSLIAEYLRMLAQVILWGLLFIIPGIVRYASLLLVPYIALLYKPYREDKVDALQVSTRITKPILFPLTLIFIAISVLQFGIELAPKGHEMLYFMPVRIAFMALSFVVAIWSYSFIFGIFKKAIEEKSWS